MTLAEAIQRSVTHDEIVHVVVVDRVQAISELMPLVDDYEYVETRSYMDVWGQVEDGSEFRLHLHFKIMTPTESEGRLH